MPSPARRPPRNLSGSRPASTLSEKAFQGWVLSLATLKGWEFYHPYDSRRSNPGWPDLCFWRDRVFFAELKTEQGVVSDDQMRVICAMRDAGADVRIWRPGDWSEICATLTRPVQPR